MSYTASVTLTPRKTERISRSFGMVHGTCDITSYNQTGAEITDITGYFHTDPVVICDGMTDNGYIVRWNTTDKCFHAFYPTNASAPTTSGNSLTIAHSASASADVAMYVKATDGLNGHFQGVSIGGASADAVQKINASNSSAFMVARHVASASKAVHAALVYYSHSGAKLLHKGAWKGDVRVPIVGANAVYNVEYSASASSGTVAVYYDKSQSDGSRVVGVSPDGSSGAGAVTASSAIFGYAPSVANAAGGEVADNVDVGVVSFVAIGLWR